MYDISLIGLLDSKIIKSCRNTQRNLLFFIQTIDIGTKYELETMFDYETEALMINLNFLIIFCLKPTIKFARSPAAGRLSMMMRFTF